MRPFGLTDLLLRVGVASALLVSAVIHLRLADEYSFAFPGGLGGGTMFRLEAVAALAAVALVLWWGGVRGHLPALLVLAGAFAAVVLYRYVPIPAIGPVPSMYEPIWYAEKTVSAIGAGVGSAVAALGVATALRRPSYRGKNSPR